jgi:hypothetical protein
MLPTVAPYRHHESVVLEEVPRIHEFAPPLSALSDRRQDRPAGGEQAQVRECALAQVPDPSAYRDEWRFVELCGEGAEIR